MFTHAFMLLQIAENISTLTRLKTCNREQSYVQMKI